MITTAAPSAKMPSIDGSRKMIRAVCVRPAREWYVSLNVAVIPTTIRMAAASPSSLRCLRKNSDTAEQLQFAITEKDSHRRLRFRALRTAESALAEPLDERGVFEELRVGIKQVL